MSNLNMHGVQDYATAMAWLAKHKTNKRGPHTLCFATTLRAEGHPSGVDVVVVYHHNTSIIRYYSDGQVDIRNAGYLTSTTTNRLHNMTPPEVRVSMARGGSVGFPAGHLDHIPHDWTTVLLGSID